MSAPMTWNPLAFSCRAFSIIVFSVKRLACLCSKVESLGFTVLGWDSANASL